MIPQAAAINDRKSKKEKIKEKSIELLTCSTCHGIPNIIRSSNSIVILMWFLFLVTSSLLGIYFTIDAILDYLSFRTETKMDLINEVNSQFPTVSFCFNPSISFSPNESITRLRFDRVDFNKTDFSLYFQEFIDPEYGSCWRFNSGTNYYNQTYEILSSTSSGLSYGVRIDLYLDKQDKYDFIDVLVSIHNRSLPPLELRNGGGLWGSTGSMSNFQVERIFNQLLDAPYSSCLKDVNLFKMNKTLINLISGQNRTYAQKDCLFYCSYLHALEDNNCGCNSTLEDFAKNCQRKPFELYNTTKNCIAAYLKEFRKNKSEKCNQYCPLQCDLISYSITPHTRPILAEGKINENMMIPFQFNLSNLTSYEEAKKHYVQLNVYYKELEYTHISQEAKTETFNFISNIGGILGLFLGISFLSFIEIFEILIECFLIFYFKG
jgi:hypothetical protein